MSAGLVPGRFHDRSPTRRDPSMTRASTVGGGLALLLALVLAPPGRAARERAPARITLEVPAAVTAGQVVELRWHGVPPDVEELELVLSLDGGRSYHVRVCPELDGRTESYAWRVPDLPTGEAKLMLRVGGEEGERIGALSPPFRIVHAEGVPRPDLVFHEGVMWAGFDPPGGPVAATLAAGAPRFADASAGSPGALPTEEARAVRPLTVRVSVVRTPAPATWTCLETLTVPREVPLRI